jgi:hypothetical protein
MRALLVLLVLAGVGYLLFGYWTGSSGNPFNRSSDGVSTTGEIDTERARARGAALGEQAAVATAKARDAVHDVSLTGKIMAKMALDDVVKARSIDVTTDGSTVTLRGRVHSAAERDRALRLTRETDGVEKVVDQLRIEP